MAWSTLFTGYQTDIQERNQTQRFNTINDNPGTDSYSLARIKEVVKKKVILYLGRLHKLKGIDLLIDAFADIIAESQEYILVIVGPDDGYLKKLKKQVNKLKLNKHVIFTGPLYGYLKKMAYESADVYVLPSVYEVFGITILEACACGIPVVITPNCGLADAIDGKAGLVSKRNRKDMKETILRILNDKELSDRFADYGKDLAALHDWGRIVPTIENIYKDCIAGKGG